MTKYIDKSSLVAEIESKKKYAQTLGDNAINSSMQQFYDGMKQGCVDILSFLDILEAKEVDLNKELSYEDYKGFFEKYPDFPDDWGFEEARTFAQYFFELGLKVAQKGEGV